jgi:hypothetical protein
LHNNKLHPYFITGLSYAEASFILAISPVKSKIGYNIYLRYNLTLHKKDRVLLEKLQNYLGVGQLYDDRDAVSYRVTALNDLQIIINHFDNYPLITKK